MHVYTFVTGAPCSHDDVPDGTPVDVRFTRTLNGTAVLTEVVYRRGKITNRPARSTGQYTVELDYVGWWQCRLGDLFVPPEGPVASAGGAAGGAADGGAAVRLRSRPSRSARPPIAAQPPLRFAPRAPRAARALLVDLAAADDRAHVPVDGERVRHGRARAGLVPRARRLGRAPRA